MNQLRSHSQRLLLKSTARGRSASSHFHSSVARCNEGGEEGDHRQVVFLRHGQSTWNKQNIFIGMTDTPLTPEGVLEAMNAGKLMKNKGFTDIDVIYTSLLRRSTKTVWLSMQEIGKEWIPVHKCWHLNERSYGMCNSIQMF